MYSVEEVADLLGLHVRTVRGYIRAGRLEAVRIGKQYRIPAAALEALTGRPRPAQDGSGGGAGRAEASSIVQIDGVGRVAADRFATFVLAGVNMAVFHLASHRTIHLWDEKPSAPPAGKIAAVLSLTLWLSIIVMGRLIGFTTTQKAHVEPPPADVNFDDFLSGGPDAPPPAQ